MNIEDLDDVDDAELKELYVSLAASHSTVTASRCFRISKCTRISMHFLPAGTRSKRHR
jgi:hypothetical protein